MVKTKGSFDRCLPIKDKLSLLKNLRCSYKGAELIAESQNEMVNKLKQIYGIKVGSK